MMQIPLWYAALAGLLLVLLFMTVLSWQQRKKPGSNAPLPEDWALTSRAVFSTGERKLNRILHQALSNHVILAKLPLVRFCQPVDFDEMRYWYNLLGSNYVSFAICASNGRVLAAIDIDKDLHGDTNAHRRRSSKIKRAVLKSCRIHYLRLPAGKLPSLAEIQTLIPRANAPMPATATASSVAAAPAPTPKEEPVFSSVEIPTPEVVLSDEVVGTVDESQSLEAITLARQSLASTVAQRRAQRNVIWKESNIFQDSFFALDSRAAHLDDPATLQPDAGNTVSPASVQPAAGDFAPSCPPETVRVTLEDMIASQRLSNIRPMDIEEARYAAGQR